MRGRTVGCPCASCVAYRKRYAKDREKNPERYARKALALRVQKAAARDTLDDPVRRAYAERMSVLKAGVSLDVALRSSEVDDEELDRRALAKWDADWGQRRAA